MQKEKGKIGKREGWGRERKRTEVREDEWRREKREATRKERKERRRAEGRES